MKRIRQASLVGQQGVNLIERIVLDMGFLWYPSGGIEAGIDGHIEIRDSASGEVKNLIVQVQSKATEQPFEAETDTTFEFRCSDKDLSYWLGGNAPVILVRSRPKTGEAYWVSIKDYFRDLNARKSKRIRFDKVRDKFEPLSKDAIFKLATPRDSGLYLAPTPFTEAISSNLLKISSIPKKYSIAQTDYRTREELYAALKELTEQVRGEWLLNNKTIASFHDLRVAPWKDICDQGTVETLDTEEWSQTDDPDRRKDFVRLLNSCLREKLYSKRVRYSRDDDYYFFQARTDLSDNKFSYLSRENRTTRTVVKGYVSKKDHTRIQFYRHAAFAGRFVRYGGQWFLQIRPSYRFTRDGRAPYRYAADYLSGIKRLENNQAVHGQVVMWASLLTERSLFDPTPLLEFSSLEEFELDVGLDDESWLKREEIAQRQQLEADPDQLVLL